MKKLFEISSEEKQRILEMHETATKKNYLNEQGPSVPTGLIDNKKYNLSSIVKDKTSLDKFVGWPNTPTLNKSSLAIVGLKPQNEPMITGGGAGEKPKHNMESLAFRLIGDYLDSIAQVVTDSKSLCNGTFNIDQIKGMSEKKFTNQFGNDDLKYLYQYFGGDKMFQAAVKRAAKEQANKFSGICNA